MSKKFAECRDITLRGRVGRDDFYNISDSTIAYRLMQQHDRLRADKAGSVKYLMFRFQIPALLFSVNSFSTTKPLFGAGQVFAFHQIYTLRMFIENNQDFTPQYLGT